MTMSVTQERYLVEHKMEYDVMLHARTGSSHETALAAHVPDDHIAKAVVVKDRHGYLVAVIPASHWLKLDALRHELDRDLHLAEENEIAALFSDCEPGAVPPLANAYGMDTLLDEALVSLADVYIEAGDHEQLIHLRGEDFQTLMSGARHGYYSH